MSFENSGDHRLGILSNSKCAIIGYSCDSECLEFPEMLNEKAVVSIGEKTFYGNSNVKTLIIPDCITDIGKEAGEKDRKGGGDTQRCVYRLSCL